MVELIKKEADTVIKLSLISMLEEYALEIKSKEKYLVELKATPSVSLPNWVRGMFMNEYEEDIKSLKVKLSLAKMLLEEL